MTTAVFSSNGNLLELLEDFPQYNLDINDFKIIGEVGNGECSKVFRATHNPTLRECAIKQIYDKNVLNDNFKSFTSEVRTLAACNNPCVIRFIGYTSVPPYSIITEYMPNNSLESFLYAPHENKKNLLTDTILTEIAIGVAWGMQYLHSISIMHRHLRVSNVLLDQNFMAKISDFGNARFVDENSILTKMIESPIYTAPEAALSNSYDYKSDIYLYGLLLYELSEKVRPYTDIKQSEIIDLVIKKGLRPNFSQITPEPLKNLITRCWSQNPDERPSFEDIFDEFHSGNVTFPKANHNEVSNYAKNLIQIQESMEPKKNTIDPENGPKISNKIQKKFKLNRKKVEEADSSYEENSSSEEEEIKDPQIDEEDEEDEDYSDLEEEEEIEENDLENICSCIKMPAIMRKSSIFDEENKIEIINYDKLTHPGFKSLLQRYSTTSLSDFDKNSAPILEYYHEGTSNVILSVIVNYSLDLMKENPEFIKLFNEKGFFTKIEDIPEEIASSLIDCYGCIVSNMPHLLNQNHVQTFIKLLKINPEKMFPLLHKYCSLFGTLESPWFIADIPLHILQDFINTKYGAEILTILYYLVTHYESYASARSSHVLSSFIIGISSTDVETISVSYDGIINLTNDFSSIDHTLIISHLSNAKLWEKSLNLLLRSQEIPYSNDFVSILMCHTCESRYTWLILLRIVTSKQDNSDLIVKSSVWMKDSSKYPKEATKLFLMLFVHEKYRQELCDSEYFGKFMESLASSQDYELFATIASILTRINLTKQIFENLEKYNFTKSFVEASLCSETNESIFSTLIVIDNLCRIGYSDSFLLYSEKLVELLTNKYLYSKVVHVITSLSFHRECAWIFIQLGLVQYFDKLKQVQKFGNLAITFLRNMKMLLSE
ncbi:TKL family protein kinase [Trichomonas vaginalis G3]|uniref:TKL family protein kinase n=1 Tax=Trichomonas vaginalis (strain ATCC PRA-98 / G3) TaxID=412133 RepID=A2DTC6_TRIV3|nr:protein kinase protein [Trichomonas vaginalis G3]EAY16398.1 TKL family protein kinase [Trichomonas vaginalis G3]KAI5488374.1 protein kinase protein [Trichomonas vaginalis G3]|eukprot:XP_001328621.1 TKL family protein kinase [Trichomonas vaginalis G3]